MGLRIEEHAPSPQFLGLHEQGLQDQAPGSPAAEILHHRHAADMAVGQHAPAADGFIAFGHQHMQGLFILAVPFQVFRHGLLVDEHAAANCGEFGFRLSPAGDFYLQLELLPVHQSRLRVDVIEQSDDVVVTADLIPGVTKKDISLDLINPQALEISWERKDEKNEEKEGYYLRERMFGSMMRIVPLPVPVTKDKATATVKNGVLEIHLKKTAKEPKGKIAIE